MIINLIGDLSELTLGIEQIKDKYSFDISEHGRDVFIIKSKDCKICGNTIYYSQNIEFFRLFIKYINNEQNIIEKRQFDTTSVMLDMSRNAVMNVDSVKEYLIYMAGFGLNSLMLYTEDTYEIESHPYMGYMRGRYTVNELIEIDEFAYNLGIEVIPCIQTLGHMSKYLRWNKNLRDTSDVLLIDSEETYDFINECISKMAEIFKTNRIHIGMDEAFSMGNGRYENLFGKPNKAEIFIKHLNRVIEICKSHNLKPMMWSDMIYNISGGNYYSDTKVNKTIEIPVVYWDYYSGEYEVYDNNIKRHKELSEEVWFAGGIWTWSGMTHCYSKTKFTLELGLKACKENGIKNILATLWGDGGAQTSYIGALNGLALLGELTYNNNADDVEKSFLNVTGNEMGFFNNVEKMDNPTIFPQPNYLIKDQVTACATRTLLWQDILLSLFDKTYENVDFSSYYKELSKELSGYSLNGFDEFYKFNIALCSALEIKGDISRVLLSNRENKVALTKIASETLTELYDRIVALKKAHRKLWCKYNKASGFEILDIRYGGVLARITTAIDTINEYINGTIECIEELFYERLPYAHDYVQNHTSVICDSDYLSIISANQI